MSENIFTLTCVNPDAAALMALHDKLTQARSIAEPEDWPAPLDEVFGEWDQPFIEKLSLRGTTLRVSLQVGSGDNLEATQVVGLTRAGAQHIRCHAWYSQQGETRTTYYAIGKKSTAKHFPDLAANDAERLLALIEDGNDGAVSKAIKAGADYREVVGGQPLFVHIADNQQLKKSIQACFASGLTSADCQPYVERMLLAIQYSGSKKAAKLVTGLLKSITPPQARAIWSNYLALSSMGPSPELLEGLLASGADVNAQLRFDEVGPDETYEQGSLLFNSVEMFEDDPVLLALLERHGARSIPPPELSERKRLWRLLRGSRDAETPAQLRDAGVDLDQMLSDRQWTAVETCLRSGDAGQALELLDAGAGLGRSAGVAYFQSWIFKGLFFPWEPKPECPQQLLELMGRLLQAGLPADMGLVLLFGFPRPGRQSGTLLGVLPLLCPPGSNLHPVLVPLARLLLQHGADPHAKLGKESPIADDAPCFDFPEYHGFCSKLKLSHLQTAYAGGGTLRDVLLRLQQAHPEHEAVALLALFD
ncbi:hypothetical protein [Pseudomonas solani]|uniref:hypothetical protein n=1 Tax=Pseudomonas solani TaxID=2731552 RepID=UPI003D6B457E